ncbi:MAG: hypothetical protein AB1814_02070 [Thermodesulfobacteriota bacterium]
MSHAIQLSAQRQVNQYARTLGEYEWFDEGNKFKALEALEAYAYAAFNNVPKLPAQYKKQAMSVFNKDKAEKAVYVGEQLGMPSKLFAVHDGNVHKPFAIKSSKFDWKVLPVEISREPVPEFVMRNLMAFRQAGTVFEKYAVAVPGSLNHVPAKFALKHETARTLQQIGTAAKAVAKAAAKASTAAAVGASAVVVGASAVVIGAIAVPAAVVAASLQDPVFLGTYGEEPAYLVEIGRWI